MWGRGTRMAHCRSLHGRPGAGGSSRPSPDFLWRVAASAGGVWFSSKTTTSRVVGESSVARMKFMRQTGLVLYVSPKVPLPSDQKNPKTPKLVGFNKIYPEGAVRIARSFHLRMGPVPQGEISWARISPRILGENLVSQWQCSLAGVSAPMKFCRQLERAQWVRFIVPGTPNSAGMWR